MLKIDKVLVPIDFSARSAPAIEHGVNIARHFDAETIFLHAVPGLPYEAAFASSLPGGLLWTPGPELEGDLRQRLEELVQEVVPEHQGECIVANGAVGSVIEGMVKRLGIDLIVMPTSGAGPFRRFLLGSVTTKVLNDTDCPVFTGPHVEDINAFAPRPYRRVGCAIDLDDGQGARVLQAAKDFAAAYEAQVTVIHALPTITAGGEGAFGSSEMAKMARTHAEAELQKLLDGAEFNNGIIIEQGPPEDVVTRVAKEKELDLLVIGRHGSKGLLSGLQTHAYGIIRRSDCPVLSV